MHSKPNFVRKNDRGKGYSTRIPLTHRTLAKFGSNHPIETSAPPWSFPYVLQEA
jgi:hypothetical protein